MYQVYVRTERFIVARYRDAGEYFGVTEMIAISITD